MPYTGYMEKLTNKTRRDRGKIINNMDTHDNFKISLMFIIILLILWVLVISFQMTRLVDEDTVSNLEERIGMIEEKL